jgi:Protein of unknown function (DUF3828)
MITRRKFAHRTAALLFWAAFPTAPAISAPAAPAETPQTFLEAIYRSYRGPDTPGIEISKAAVMRRYFIPALAAAMIKDAAQAAKRSEVPALDGDPFVDAQDWDIANLKIDVKMSGAAKAAGTVSFTNFNEPRTVTLDLVKLSAGWRIADIKMKGRSLRELYPAR